MVGGVKAWVEAESPIYHVRRLYACVVSTSGIAMLRLPRISQKNTLENSCCIYGVPKRIYCKRQEIVLCSVGGEPRWYCGMTMRLSMLPYRVCFKTFSGGTPAKLSLGEPCR